MRVITHPRDHRDHRVIRSKDADDERRLRLRWMSAEVGRIRDELESVRVELDLVIAAEQRALSPAERTRRRDLLLSVRALELRIKELRLEFEALRTG